MTNSQKNQLQQQLWNIADSLRDKAQEQRKAILAMLGKETQLRSKRELIERFIDDYLPAIGGDEHVGESFAIY
jgi:type I restriction enzyme R subunit